LHRLADVEQDEFDPVTSHADDWPTSPIDQPAWWRSWQDSTSSSRRVAA
jgi:hypothetical protein